MCIYIYIFKSDRMPGFKKPMIPDKTPEQTSKTKNHKPGLTHPGFKKPPATCHAK